MEIRSVMRTHLIFLFIKKLEISYESSLTYGGKPIQTFTIKIKNVTNSSKGVLTYLLKGQ